MLLPKFDYHAPNTTNEATTLLGRFGPKAKCLAGGTDLLVNLKKKLLVPEQIISLNKIPGYAEAAAQNGQGLSLGPLCTASYLAGSKVVQDKGTVLAQAAGKLGSPLIRNRATVGGNLVTARPASDLAPALLALGAQVRLDSSRGRRILPLEDFLLGPGQTAIQLDEILTEITFPVADGPSFGVYLKLGTRKTLEISLVNAASFLALGPDGAIQTARVALGAVAPIPILSPGAAKVLIGSKPKDEKDPIFKEAARVAARDSKPITDHRGSAEYRREMVEVLTQRTLSSAYQQLIKNA